MDWIAVLKLTGQEVLETSEQVPHIVHRHKNPVGDYFLENENNLQQDFWIPERQLKGPGSVYVAPQSRGNNLTIANELHYLTKHLNENELGEKI